MQDWTKNTIMSWIGTGPNGVTGTFKVSDHSREGLNVSTNRHGTDKRMANGTLRRFHIRNHRQWSLSWSVLPSIQGPHGFLRPVDGGMSGRELEDFYDANPGRFRMVIRNGSAEGKVVPAGATTLGAKYEDADFYGADVMITEFSHEISKRGAVDLWRVQITLEEV